MLGESKVDWLNSLKVALVTKNETKLIELIETMPIFNNLEEIETASYLLNQTQNYFQDEKNTLAIAISKTKKHMEFAKSSYDEQTSIFKKSC